MPRRLLLIAVLVTACSPQGKSAIVVDQVSGVDIGSPAPAPGPSHTPAPQPFPEDAQKFDQPWKRTDTSIVIDAYEGNAINWDKMAADARVVGVIHRSSIGMTADKLYADRQAIAQSRGYLWGAYHLGRSTDAVQQADFFLVTIGDPKNVMMVLDLEDTSASGMMTIAGAKQFMKRVLDKTGRLPVVYANHSVTQALNAAVAGDPLFTGSQLWYARFRTNIPDFPVGIWSTYFLWQFSSEINCSSTGNCLYNVPGTSFDMDVNVYYGSPAALREQWVRGN